MMRTQTCGKLKKFEFAIKFLLIKFGRQVLFKKKMWGRKSHLVSRLCLTTRYGIFYIVAGCQTSFNKFSHHLRQEKFPDLIFHEILALPKFSFSRHPRANLILAVYCSLIWHSQNRWACNLINLLHHQPTYDFQNVYKRACPALRASCHKFSLHTWLSTPTSATEKEDD